MGQILGEGFFGEVENGVYKNQVSLFIIYVTSVPKITEDQSKYALL